MSARAISPDAPLDGHCRCGRVRFRLSAPPMISVACHCTGCQRMTASAFSLSIAIPATGFAVVSGETAIGGLHGATRHHFCGHCMSWLFTQMEGMDDFINVRATMLEDMGWSAPFVETFTRDKLAWVTTPARHSFADIPAPDAWPGLMAEYARGA